MSRAWMPLYIGDFTADTMHLNATETGIYIRLIMHCWQHGSIPYDERQLALIAHVSPRLWNRHRGTIMPFFDVDQSGPRLVNNRVALERLRYDEKRNKNKAGAEKTNTLRASQSQRFPDTIEDAQSGPRYCDIEDACERPRYDEKRNENKAGIAKERTLRARASQSQSQSHSSEPPKSFNPDPVGSELNLTRGVSAADAAQECPRDILFNQGLRILIAITGKTPDSARRLIGHWLKMAKDEAVRVVTAIEHAEVNRIADPVAWINRALQPRTPLGAKKPFNEIFDDMREDLKNVRRNSEFGNRPGSGFVRLVPPNRRK
jgi:uncharacterized protein YdaU (DUF1376 family)